MRGKEARRKLIVNNDKRILFKVTRTMSIGFLAFLLLAMTLLPVSLTTLTAGWSYVSESEIHRTSAMNASRRMIS